MNVAMINPKQGEPIYYVKKISFTSKGGAIVERGVINPQFEANSSGRTSGKIKYLSDNSRKKLAFVASNAVCGWGSMITLTYSRDYPRDGATIKKDLNRFLSLLRTKIEGVKYLWFLEFQKRGAPHCHILLSVDFLEEHHEALAKSWCKTVTRGNELDDLYCEHVRWFNSLERKVSGASGCQFWQGAKLSGGLGRYAVKYATKTEQKSVPVDYWNVGRFWGASRGLVEIQAVTTYEVGDYIPSVDKLFPDKPLTGLPRYIFGSG